MQQSIEGMDVTLHPRFPAQETLQLVCNLRDLKASRRMVLTFLVLRTNRTTGCTFVSNAAIALGCGMGLTAVVECLYDLEKVHKVITRTVRNGRSHTTKNTEVLVHLNPLPVAHEPDHQASGSTQSADALCHARQQPL